MKKIKASIIIIAVICLIVFILLGNKAKIEEKIARNVSLMPTVSVVQVGRQDFGKSFRHRHRYCQPRCHGYI